MSKFDVAEMTALVIEELVRSLTLHIDNSLFPPRVFDRENRN